MQDNRCPHIPGSTECLSWPCNGLALCDGVETFEMPMGVQIDQAHPLMDGSRVGPNRPRLGGVKKKPKRVMIEVREDLAPIFQAIDKENCYACDKWGTDFDDHNTINDWAAYVNIYLAHATTLRATVEQQKSGVIKAGNLCIGALLALARNGKFADRHYD